METTLEQLYEMQKALDATIIEKKGLQGQDLLPNTVLALQVELGELANEWRGFKHWSNDQEPRTKKLHSDRDAYLETNPLLEEYVDCLHFFLSIARQLDLPVDALYQPEDYFEQDTTLLFVDILHNVGLIIGDRLGCEIEDFAHWQKEYFETALFVFYGLGTQRLGFTIEEIFAAYLEKNKTNHDRQVNGY